jgi:Tol biopolymer transport system component
MAGVMLASCTGTAGSRSESPSSSVVDAGSPSVPPSAGDVPVVGAGEDWIAFQRIAGTGDGIFLVRPDGTGQHQLVADLDGSEIHPDWSPDGKRIAFIHVTPADRNELWVVSAEGTDAARLYACEVPCNTITYPDWAPDGNAIYYGIDANATGGPPTTFGVGKFDLASEEASWVLTREDGMSAEQPRISPDGEGVVYTRFNEPQGSAIFISDLKGGRETRLTAWELWGAHPDWSVEDRIVLNSYDLGVFQDTTEPANLYSVALDGSDLRQLTTFGDHDTRCTQPRWTPDGSGIIFTQVDGEGFGQRHMAFVNADGSGIRFLTPEPIDGTHSQLRPVSEE